MKATTNAFELARLGDALAALAKETRGDQAARGADRILERMKATTHPRELVRLGDALAALVENVKDQRERLQIFRGLSGMPLGVDCSRAAPGATREELSLLVDMLKWPICGKSRDGLMLRLAELQSTDPHEFGVFSDANDRSSFRADLRTFIRCLEKQKGPDGKPLDVADSPMYNPYYPSRKQVRTPWLPPQE
jgi:hypothetical protein